MSDCMTPTSRWWENGENDPHGKIYDCERNDLPFGDLTDDEFANAFYLCNHRTSLESAGYLIAAKDRIRWLSRKTNKLTAEIETLKAENARLRRVVRGTVMGLEHAAFYLSHQTEADVRNVVVTTCPEKSLLIAIRDLKKALSAPAISETTGEVEI